MPNRWNPKTRAVYYAYLCARDGELCHACGRRPYQVDHPLEIDEINCRRTDHRKDNLQLLCKSCNVARRNYIESKRRKWVLPPRKLALDNPNAWGPELACGHVANPPLFNSVTSEVSPSDCVCDTQLRHGRATKFAASYHLGSPEMRANELYEPIARAWILQQVNQHGQIDKREAITGAAELSGASVPTVERNYLPKLTSPMGPLEEIEDQTHTVLLIPRGQLPLPDGEDEPVDEPAPEPESAAAPTRKPRARPGARRRPPRRLSTTAKEAP